MCDREKVCTRGDNIERSAKKERIIDGAQYCTEGVIQKMGGNDRKGDVL